jgi:hypothetical protein
MTNVIKHPKAKIAKLVRKARKESKKSVKQLKQILKDPATSYEDRIEAANLIIRLGEARDFENPKGMVKPVFDHRFGVCFEAPKRFGDAP